MENVYVSVVLVAIMVVLSAFFSGMEKNRSYSSSLMLLLRCCANCWDTPLSHSASLPPLCAAQQHRSSVQIISVFIWIILAICLSIIFFKHINFSQFSNNLLISKI